MTKDKALHMILHFGREKEHMLIAKGETVAAYQIEHARITLHYALNHSIKTVRETLDKMIDMSIAEDGTWEYHPALFVHDEETRKMLSDLREQFNKKGARR